MCASDPVTYGYEREEERERERVVAVNYDYKSQRKKKRRREIEIGIEHYRCMVWGCGEDGPISSNESAHRPSSPAAQSDFPNRNLPPAISRPGTICTWKNNTNGFPAFLRVLYYV